MENQNHNFVISFQDQVSLEKFKDKNAKTFVFRAIEELTEQSALSDFAGSMPVVYTTVGNGVKDLLDKFQPQKLIYLVRVIAFISFDSKTIYPIRSKRTPCGWTPVELFFKAYDISYKE